MTTKNEKLTYSQSGVDIDKANDLVNSIKPIVAQTLNDRVISDLGGFGGLFKLDIDAYKKPVLVSGTDGVGTKIMLAKQMASFDQIGIDLVAMCVNDVITLGAKPLFFLDYFATSKLNSNEATNIIKGIAEGCIQSEMALIGGETAEMPGLYQSGDFDLAGFCVGVVDYDQIIDGKCIEPSDAIIGIASSGPHSNGYSLIRKIIELNSSDLEQRVGNRSLGEALIEPTTIYSRVVNEVNKNFAINGMVHITGGGFKENIVRILPNDVNAKVNLGSWKQPEIFDWIQEEGKVDQEEMLKTFNCGIGYILIVDKETTTDVIKVINNLDQQAFHIGDISAGDKKVRLNP
jgi:phosphoribosylformylglycinamidine cyclo-ligase